MNPPSDNPTEEEFEAFLDAIDAEPEPPEVWCLHCREYVTTEPDGGMTVCSECGYPDLANGPPDEDDTANDCTTCGGGGGCDGHWCPDCAGTGRRKSDGRDDYEIICN